MRIKILNKWLQIPSPSLKIKPLSLAVARNERVYSRITILTLVQIPTILRAEDSDILCVGCVGRVVFGNGFVDTELAEPEHDFVGFVSATFAVSTFGAWEVVRCCDNYELRDTYLRIDRIQYWRLPC